MRVSVCKISTFAAAHYLPNYEGKCRNLHGHTWTLEVEVSGEVDKESGMVIDFAVLKSIVNTLVIKVFDHKCLNDIGFINPTCEVVLSWIWDVLNSRLTQNTRKLERIRLYESPGSFAELKSVGRTVEKP